MNIVLRKIVMGVLIAGLGLAGLSIGSVYAAGSSEPPTPATSTPVAPSPDLVNARLERAFTRQTRIVERLGKLYDNSDQGFTRIQNLLDKAKERGLDVSQVQAALDAVKNALPKGRPFYEQAKSIVNSHKGFDASGKVTDPEAAKATVKSLHDALGQFRTAMGGTVKALREAIQAFRKANPRPSPTP